MRPLSILTTALLLTAALAAIAAPAAALDATDPAIAVAADATSTAPQCAPFHAETPFGGIMLHRDCSISIGTP
jgi:hypothetical protein